MCLVPFLLRLPSELRVFVRCEDRVIEGSPRFRSVLNSGSLEARVTKSFRAEGDCPSPVYAMRGGFSAKLQGTYQASVQGSPISPASNATSASPISHLPPQDAGLHILPSNLHAFQVPEPDCHIPGSHQRVVFIRFGGHNSPTRQPITMKLLLQ